MSFTEKIASLMARPGSDPPSDESIPFWLKYGSRILGTFGGFFALLVGLLNTFSIITLNVKCLLAGVLLMIIGFIAIIFEAPCCCLFIDFVQAISNKIDSKPPLYKAVFYMIAGILPIILCADVSVILCCLLFLGTGALYGMISLGRKASATEMQSSAINIETGRGRNDLIPNAAPLGTSVPPQFSAH